MVERLENYVCSIWLLKIFDDNKREQKKGNWLGSKFKNYLMYIQCNAMSSILVITREILNEFKPMNLKYNPILLFKFQSLFKSFYRKFKRNVYLMRSSSLPVWKIKKINQFSKLPTVHPALFSHVPYEVDSS